MRPMPTASPAAISWNTPSSAARHIGMSSTLATSALLSSSTCEPPMQGASGVELAADRGLGFLDHGGGVGGERVEDPLDLIVGRDIDVEIHFLRVGQELG